MAAIVLGAAALAGSGPVAAQGEDHSPPSLTVPANQNRILPPGAATMVVTWPDPVATDNVGVTSLTCNHASGARFVRGVTVVTCTATDAADNTASGSFVITVVDAEPPVITVPASRNVLTGSASTVTVTWPDPTATDNVGVTDLSCSRTSGVALPPGIYVVTCTAGDASGNTDSDSFSITVRDNGAPSLTVPANQNRILPPGAATMVVTWPDPVATDNVGVTSLTCNHASGARFVRGVTVVTCTATDAADNTASGSFTITVVDAEPPHLVAPDSITAPTDPGLASAQVGWPALSATDNVGVSDVSCDPASGTRFALGTTTVTCTARDASGNEDQARFTVEVVDREAPTVTVVGDRRITLDPGVTSAAVTWPDPTATDNVGVASLVCDPTSGATFGVGSTTVRCTATDAAGNTGEARFEVIVETTTPTTPTIPMLIDDIAGAGLKPSVAESLIRPLEDALALLTDARTRNDVRGCQKLDRFAEVLAKKETRSRVDAELAGRWTADAAEIGQAFGC